MRMPGARAFDRVVKQWVPRMRDQQHACIALADWMHTLPQPLHTVPPPPPPSLQERIDAVAGALAAAFASLAARLRGTLQGCFMERLHVEKMVCAPCIRPPAPKATGDAPWLPAVRAQRPNNSAEALGAAAAAYQQLLEAAHAEYGSLPPAAAALSESARAAAVVLLQKAQLVAAVLKEAGVPEAAAADDGEVIRKQASAEVQLAGVAEEAGGKLAAEGKAGEESV